jgi:hypothetical protein
LGDFLIAQKMEKQEILKRCEWDEYDMATLTVFSEMFGRDVEVRLIPGQDTGRDVSATMVAVLNDFLALKKEDLETVKEYLWEDCKDAFANVSYGVDAREGETETEANFREFGIHDKEDAYNQSDFDCVAIDGDDDIFQNRYGMIRFYPVWEQEHGCGIVMQNGKLIARYSNDVYFGRYEEEPQKSQQRYLVPQLTQ